MLSTMVQIQRNNSSRLLRSEVLQLRMQFDEQGSIRLGLTKASLQRRVTSSCSIVFTLVEESTPKMDLETCLYNALHTSRAETQAETEEHISSEEVTGSVGSNVKMLE